MPRRPLVRITQPRINDLFSDDRRPMHKNGVFLKVLLQVSNLMEVMSISVSDFNGKELGSPPRSIAHNEPDSGCDCRYSR